MDSFPAPKSPPDYAQLYGKRQQIIKVQALEREIAILEEEIKSLDGIPLASSCCKELDDFVQENADPLVLEINEEIVTSNCFHKRQRQKSGSGTKSSWNCCLCCPLSGNTQCCCCPRLDETECSCSRCSSCLKSCTLKLFCPCCSCCLSKSFCRKMKCCRCCCCCCRKSCCGSCLGFH